MQSLRFYLSFTLFALLMFSCDDQRQSEDPIPFVIVNETINLNNLQYLPLKSIGGYVTHNAGVRGLILYRESNSVYRAFERNCPFQPLNACALVEIDDSGLFMQDACCGSRFSFSGFPIEGPSVRPLLEYNTTIDGNFLLITN